MKISNAQHSIFNSETIRERGSQLILFFITLAVRLSLVVVGLGAKQPLAGSTIVIYNKGAPDSVEVAKFYGDKRGDSTI